MSFSGVLKNNKGLILFTLLNYIDKGLFFLLPLTVLYLIDDRDVYNTIEYVIAVSVVLNSFIDSGFRYYQFYGYRIAPDKNAFLYEDRSIFGSILVTLALVCCLILVGASVLSEGWLVFFVALRVLFLFISQYFLNYYRLAGRPNKVYLITFFAYVVSLIALVIYYFLPNGYLLMTFFTGQGLAIVVTVIRSVRQLEIDFVAIKERLRVSIVYSWPIIANTLAVTILGNYGKIYAFNFLSSSEMYTISFALRIAMIVQLAHASTARYLTKSVYETDSRKNLNRIVVKYLVSLLASLPGVMIFSSAIEFLGLGETVPLWGVASLFVLFVLTQCLSSFTEQFFNKHNRTKYLLVGVSSSFVLFWVGLLTQPITIEFIGLIMFSSIFLNLLINIWLIRKLGLYH